MTRTCEGVVLLAMDVDGTLTDGRIYTSPSGEGLKAFDVKDGLGIAKLLPAMGVIPVVITGRRSRILELRCEELGIKELHQEVGDKLPVLREIAAKHSCGFENVAYIGDDLNDLDCIQAVRAEGGLTACPSDAASEVMNAASYVSSKAGGRGAVRDFIEWMAVRQTVRG